MSNYYCFIVLFAICSLSLWVQTAAVCSNSVPVARYPSTTQFNFGEPMYFTEGGAARAFVAHTPSSSGDGTYRPYSWGLEVSDKLLRVPFQAPENVSANDCHPDIPAAVSTARRAQVFCLAPPSRTATTAVPLSRIKVVLDIGPLTASFEVGRGGSVTADIAGISCTVSWGKRASSAAKPSIPDAFIPQGFIYDNSTALYRFREDRTCRVSSGPPIGSLLELIPGDESAAGVHLVVPRTALLNETAKCYGIPLPIAKEQPSATYLPTQWCIRSFQGVYRISFEKLQYLPGIPLTLKKCQGRSTSTTRCAAPNVVCCTTQGTASCQPPGSC